MAQRKEDRPGILVKATCKYLGRNHSIKCDYPTGYGDEQNARYRVTLSIAGEKGRLSWTTNPCSLMGRLDTIVDQSFRVLLLTTDLRALKISRRLRSVFTTLAKQKAVSMDLWDRTWRFLPAKDNNPKNQPFRFIITKDKSDLEE